MYEIYEKLLKQKGCRTVDVCDATGIRQSLISDWKAGRYTPKVDKLQKIADFFGVSVEYLMTGENPSGYYINPETAAAAQKMFENPELRVLFDAARDASPEDLKIVYDMLLALKRKENRADG